MSGIGFAPTCWALCSAIASIAAYCIGHFLGALFGHH